METQGPHLLETGNELYTLTHPGSVTPPQTEELESSAELVKVLDDFTITMGLSPVGVPVSLNDYPDYGNDSGFVPSSSRAALFISGKVLARSTTGKLLFLSVILAFHSSSATFLFSSF